MSRDLLPLTFLSRCVRNGYRTKRITTSPESLLIHTRGRMIVGAAVGVVVVGVHLVSAILNLFVHASIQERVTTQAVGAAFAYVSLFAIGGAAIARLSMLAVGWPTYIVGGMITGGLVWSYLTITWPFTARASAIGPPTVGPVEATIQGIVLGAIAGALLLGMALLRRRYAKTRAV